MHPEPNDPGESDSPQDRQVYNEDSDPQSLALCIAVTLGDVVLKRTVKKIAKYIMGFPPSDIFGDGRGFKSLWDEFCVVMYFRDSIHASLFELQMDHFVSGHLEEMSPLDLWAIYFLANGDPPEKWVSVSTERPDLDPIVKHVGAEVFRMADGWSNKQIRSYIDANSYRTE